MPLAIELITTGDMSPQSLSISATMYAATIGVSSRWPVVLAAVIVSLVFFAPLYGIALSHQDPTGVSLRQAYTQGQGTYLEEMIHHGLKRYSIYLISAVFVLHLIERFNRHVLKKEPFWSFDWETPNA